MTAVTIGAKRHGTGNIVLTAPARRLHTHLIGASGTGKSFLLEYMARKDIANGCGVCLIDPHGETYNNLVAWLATSGVRHKDVHLINPSRGASSVGFNPLCVPGNDPARRVLDMVEACIHVWGGNDMHETPRLRKCLRSTFYALAYHQLSLLEANIFTSTRHRAVRQKLTRCLPPLTGFRDEWAEFDTYSDREYREYFESTRSRIFEFITAPALRPIIGQTENVLDLRQCMEQGHIVLVNLAESAELHEQEAQVLGAMIVADLYASAKQRDPTYAERRPFYAYVDECASFLNEVIAKSLDRTRKYGLHFVLAHQRLGQLREAGDNIHDAVMAMAQNKIVFRVDDDDNAEQLCRNMLRSEFDLEIPKRSLDKPVAVGQSTVTLYNQSQSESDSNTGTQTQGGANVSTAGTSQYRPDYGASSGHTESVSTGDTSAWSSSESRSKTQSHTTGSAEALKTDYEVMPTAVYSLEEIIHMGIRTIRELPDRCALVRVVGERATLIYTLDVPKRRPLAIQVHRFVDRASQKSRYTIANEEAENLIAKRRKMFFAKLDDTEHPFEPDDFFE